MGLPRKVWLSLGVLAAVLAAAAGIGYAAIPDSNGTIHACMLNATGTVRLIDPSGNANDLRSHCTKLETEVKWNQQGQPGAPGPAGNTDSTVRHMNNFISNGQTASSPVISGAGQLGTLSFTCDEVTYTTNTADTANGFGDRVMFYSPVVPDSPLNAVLVQNGNSDHLTVPWTGQSLNRPFQMLIEGQTGTESDVTLTSITGWVRNFPEFSGCSFFALIQTSDVRAPQTITP